MKYKYVPISRAIMIPVPTGLTREQETAFIDQYIAEQKPEDDLRRFIAEDSSAEADIRCKDAMDHPDRCLPLEAVIEALERDSSVRTGDDA